MADLTFLSYTDKWHNEPYPFISPTRKELSAAGKHVVVTGGGTGIGRSISISFAQAGAASVSILGRRIAPLQASADLIRAANPETKVFHASADLTDKAAVEAALKSLTDQTGAKIDIFVSNAGTLPTQGSPNDLDVDIVKQGLDSNVVASFNAVRAFIPHAAPGAKVFNTSSGIGHMAPLPGMLIYALAKAASIKLFEYFAANNPDLHFVQIQPGVVGTDMQAGSGINAQDDEKLPGHFTVWLASDEAAFLRNKYIWVNWDAEELISKAQRIQESKDLEVHLGGVPM